MAAELREGEVPPIRYLGGVVQHHPVVHLLYWGSNWQSAEYGNVATELGILFGNLENSSYQGILTQYFDSNGYISPQISVDELPDTGVSAPSNVNEAAVEAEVEHAESLWGHNLETQYIILPAPGTTYEPEFAEGFCAYHDVSPNGAIYSFVPYAGDAPFSTENFCGWYGHEDFADATSSLASHEYAESATDPLWDTAPGWRNRADSEGEISDICATPGEELPSGATAQGQYDDHLAVCAMADEHPPHVLGLSEPATNVSPHSATLNATVNPEGSSTNYKFEYGPTTSYGQTLPASWVNVGSGWSDVHVSQQLAGLELEHVYHYRVVASNANGTTYGEDHTAIPSTWQVATPGHEAQWSESWLNDVSCASSAACMAVGYYYQPGLKPEANQALAYRKVGSEWVQLAVPQTEEEAWPQLGAVSCPSTSTCVAVGRGSVAEHFRPLIVRWNGSSWQTEHLSAPAGTLSMELNGLSCRGGSAEECIAVGSRRNESGTWVNYTAEYSGGSWRNLSTPTSAESTESELAGVECPAAGKCIAVGWYNPTSGGGSKPFSMQLASGSWQLQSRSWSGYLEGITCTEATNCIAVGNDYDIGASTETWNGTEWSAAKTIGLPDVNGGFLADVSCSSSSDCVAVGAGWSKADEAPVTLAEKWNGASWSERTTPRESEVAPNWFESVSCVSSQCVGAGLSTASDNQQALLETRKDWRPTVSTSEPSVGLNRGYVILFGKANPNGLDTTYHFEWGTQAEYEAGKYGHLDPVPNADIGSGESTVEFSQQPSGMKGETKYHFRLVAQNQEGTASSPDYSFTTPNWRPALTRIKQHGVGRTTAKLGAFIDPMSHATAYHFEWGTQAEYEKGKYGHTLPVPNASVGLGYEPVEVSQVVEGLEQRKTYHFRLVAENEEGKSTSSDGTFTTSTSGFSVDSQPAIVIGGVVGFDHSFAFDAGRTYDCVQSPVLEGEMSSLSESLITAVSGAECNRGGIWPEKTTLEMRGCKFIFHPGAEVKPGRFAGNMEIGPSGCGPMVLKGESCNWVFAPQDGIDATFEDEGAGKAATVGIEVNSELQYSVEGTLTNCGAAGWATYQGSWKLKALKEGEATGLRVYGLFKTAPVVGTGNASNVTFGSATVQGTVNPELLPTTYQFEYGPTTAYGSRAPATPKSAGSGESSVAVSESLAGLKLHTTYHYRIVATNSEGTSYGKDAVFTTLAHRTTRLEADSYPLTISGEQESGAKEVVSFANNTRPVSCGKAKLNWNVSPLSALSLTPEYSSCNAEILGNTDPAEVLANSCHYSVSLANTAPPYSATLGVSCSKEGDGLEFLAYENEAKYKNHEATLCRYKIAPQSGLKGIGVSNFGSGSEAGVSLKFESVSVPYTRVSGTLTNCGTSSGSAVYTGTVKMQGQSESKSPIGIHVATGEPAVGIAAAGTSNPKFEAGKYPSLLAGEQEPMAKSAVTFPGSRKFECGAAYLEGEATAASASLLFEPQGSSCNAEILGNTDPAEVLANSCHYSVSLANTAPPYSATLGVSCSKEGDGLEFLAYENEAKYEEQKVSLCRYKVAPQSGLKGIGVTDFGSGSEAGVSLKFESVSVPYTRVSGTLTNCGTSSGSATYTGTTDVWGF